MNFFWVGGGKRKFLRNQIHLRARMYYVMILNHVKKKIQGFTGICAGHARSAGLDVFLQNMCLKLY